MDVALVVARFVHFAATMTLFGAALFIAALAPPALAAELGAPMRRFTPGLTWLALASAVAWFLLVAREMAGGELDLDTIETVFGQTSFGVNWSGRLVLLFALALFAPWLPRAALAVGAGLAVASLALVGHAAAQTGWLGLAHRLNHAIHLLCAAAWLGGLPPFLACLRRYGQSPGNRDALTGMIRYSRIGHVFVAVVLATGAFEVAMTTANWPFPLDSGYRRGLAAKIAVVAAMTALAVFNRYRLAPRLSRSPNAVRALSVGVFAQAALALTAIALVSAFATLDPH